VAGYELHSVRHPDAAARVASNRQLHERLTAHPGVEAVALAEILPGATLTSAWGRLPVEIEGIGEADGQPDVATYVAFVGPDYFSVLGAPLLDGREFSWNDRPGGQPAVIVTESFARRHFTGGRAVGRQLRGPEDQRWEIVGVAPDVGLAGPEASRARLYLPLSERPFAAPYVLLRARGSPQDLLPVVRESIRELDPQVPISPLELLGPLLARERRPARIMIPLFASFGVAALLLAALGLHGVLSFSVGRRTREIAVRRAVGARHGSVARLVLAATGWQVLLGAVVGLALTYALAPRMGELLFGGDPESPVAYTVTFAAVALATLAAAGGPLRRALRLPLVETLKAE